MKTKLFSLFLMLVASVGTIFASTTVQIGSLFYSLDATAKTASVTYPPTGSITYSGMINIPAYVTYQSEQYDVVSIGSHAFYTDKTLTSVTIPNSVTSIGNSAFEGCSGLTSITIPNSVTSIGNSVFSGCTGLTSPIFNAHVFAFMPTYYSGAYTIPDGIESISGYAFAGCIGMTSVTIPNSVISIRESAFSVCTMLTAVNISDLAVWCNVAFEDYRSNPLYYAEHLYLNGIEIIDLIIPDSVTSIGSGAFQSCTSLASVTIPNSVTRIGSAAFYGCAGLTSVIIGNNVTSIGGAAFDGCSKLSSVAIPNNVTSIGSNVFNGCTGLKSVTIGNSVTSIGENAFSGCNKLTTVNILSNSIVSREYTMYNNLRNVFGAQVETYMLGNDVTSIGTCAFNGCTGLESVSIGNGITKIGLYAFRRCTKLTSLTTSNTIMKISDAFDNTDNTIKTINFKGDLAGWCSKQWSPASISFDYTLYINNERISSVIVPDSVTSICSGAFCYCKNLTSVTLHSNISSIGYGAFEDCGSLKGIYVPCGEKDRFKQMYSSNLIQYTPSPYKVTSTVIGNGSVQVTDNTICNDSVKITAKPGNYCHFVQWSDGRTDNPLILPLVGDIDVQATFAENPKITYYCNKEQGYVSGPTTTPTGKAQATITFTANSNYGYHFDKWNDGNTDNPRSVFITQDTTFTAYFAFDKSGTCGNGNALKWTYEDKSKTLTINGSGELNENYTFGLEAPSQMQNLIIGNDVTAIGNNAFKGETTINHLTIGCNVASIGNYAFSECKNFDDITCYAQTVPTITDKTFENIGNKKYIYLFVPEGRQRAYQRDDYWGEFDIQVKEATTTDVTGLTIIPEESTATVAWPSVSGAATYELVIKDEEGKVICTLTFNAQGQLTSIAFNAPSCDGAPQHTQTAGFTFTITGLEAGTEYNLTITAKNASGQEIDKKNSSFHTNWPNGIENLHVDSDKPVKVLMDGQIYILRGEHVYDTEGKMVK